MGLRPRVQVHVSPKTSSPTIPLARADMGGFHAHAQAAIIRDGGWRGGAPRAAPWGACAGRRRRAGKGRGHHSAGRWQGARIGARLAQGLPVARSTGRRSRSAAARATATAVRQPTTHERSATIQCIYTRISIFERSSLVSCVECSVLRAFVCFVRCAWVRVRVACVAVAVATPRRYVRVRSRSIFSFW
jgi:hypothetical protein